MEKLKLERLNALLERTWQRNPFYRNKWADAGLRRRESLQSIEELREFPFTTRPELIADQNRTPPLGTNLSVPLNAIKRIYHSSGTSGDPLYWGDTKASLRWVATSSRQLFEISGLKSSDRMLIFLPLSGYSGPWLILEGAFDLQCEVLTSFDPSEAFRLITRFRPNIIVGRPNAFLHLSQTVREAGIRPFELGIEKLISSCSGITQTMIETLNLDWGATILTRYGMTEAGSIASQCPESEGLLHVLESQFIIESFDAASGKPAADGASGELVLTTLGRFDKPIIRYRTGDHMRLIHQYSCPCGRTGTVIQGGITRLNSVGREIALPAVRA